MAFDLLCDPRLKLRSRWKTSPKSRGWTKGAGDDKWNDETKSSTSSHLPTWLGLSGPAKNLTNERCQCRRLLVVTGFVTVIKQQRKTTHLLV